MLLLMFLWFFEEPAAVANGLKAKGGKMTLELVEDLRFGADEDEDHFIWPQPETRLAVGPNGAIYVADSAESRILKFNDQGQFEKIIAHKGPGPGELKSLGTLNFLADGGAVAVEALIMAVPRFHFFDSNMAYQETKTPIGAERFHSRVTWSPTGDFFISRYLSFNDTGKRFDHMGLFNKDLELIRSVSQLEQTMHMRRLSEPGYLAQFLGESLEDAYEPYGVLNFGADGKLYEAKSNEYQITLWDAELKNKLMVVKKDYKPKPNTSAQIRGVLDRIADRYRAFQSMNSLMTEAFLQKVADKADLSPALNPVFAIIPMEDGHFLVVHHLDAVTGRQTADIFNPKGLFLGETTLENWAFMDQTGGPRMLFKGKYAYTMETDQEGDNRAVRYQWRLVPVK